MGGRGGEEKGERDSGEGECEGIVMRAIRGPKVRKPIAIKE